MALVGPSITVACQNPDCDQFGIEKHVRSTVLGIDRYSNLLDWPKVTCGTCLLEPIEIKGPQ